MTDVTSNLGVRVETGDAAAQLLALNAALHGSATGLAQLGAAVTAHAGNIQAALANLAKTGFTGLSVGLDRETAKIHESLTLLADEVSKSFKGKGKKAGKQIADEVTAGLNEGTPEMLATAERQAQELSKRYISRSKANHQVMLATAIAEGKRRLDAGKSIHAQQGQELMMQYQQIAAQERAAHAQQGQELMMQYQQRTGKERAAHAQQGQELLMQYQQRNAQERAAHAQQGQELMMQYQQRTGKERAAHAQQGQELLMQYQQRNAQERAAHAQQGQELLAQYEQFAARERAAHAQQGQMLMAQYLAQEAQRAARLKDFNQFGAMPGASLNQGDMAAYHASPEYARAQSEAILMNERMAVSTRNASSAMRAWSAAGRDAHDVARGLSGALGGLWLTYGQLLPIMAGFAIAASLKGAFTASRDFAYQMEFVGAVSGDSAKQIDAVSTSLIAMSKASMFKPLELAQGMRVLAQAGMSTTDALATLPTVMALATVGETDLATAAETATGIMHAFGLQTSDIGHIGDVIAKAAAISVTSVASMSESMKQASTIAQQYDLSLTEVSGGLVALAERNITGQAAGTAFRNMMNELSNPTEKAQHAFDKLGVHLYDSQGKARDLTVVMDELRKAMGKYDKQTQNLLSSTMFGERGSKPFQAIMADTPKDWADMVKKLDDSNGFLDQSMTRLENTVEGRFKNMAANAQAAMLSIGEGSQQPLMDLANTLSALFNNQNLIHGIQSLANGIIGLTNFVAEHIKGLGLIAGAYLAFKTAGVAVMALAAIYLKLRDAQVIVATTTGVLMGAQTAQAAMMGTTLPSAAAASTGALTALTTAMLANPVLWLTGIVGALAVAYLTLRDNTNGAAQANRDAETAGNAAIDLLQRELKTVQDLNAAKERTLGLRPALTEENRAAVQSERDIVAARIAKSQVDPRAQYGLELVAKEKAHPWTSRLLRLGSQAEDMAKADGLLKDRALKQKLDREVANLETAKLRAADLAAVTSPPVSKNVGTDHLTPEQLGLVRYKHKPKTDPIPVQDYSEPIKAYSAHLSEIDSIEQNALARSKAFREAGLSSEQAYLTERNSIRAKADTDAKQQLDDFLQAQVTVADTALSAQAKQATEAKAKGLTNDAATINKMTALGNQAKEAWDKADRARTAYDLHSKQRKDAEVLDTLAGLKSDFVNPDKAVKEAQEFNAALRAQVDATKGLQHVTRDKNIISMEGSLRSLDGLIAEVEATKSITGVTEEEIVALKNKRALIAGDLDKYTAVSTESKRGDGTAGAGLLKGLQDYQKGATDIFSTVQNMSKQMFKSMEDNMVEYVMTGKFSFNDMANSIIKDLVRIAVQQAITKPLASAAESAAPAIFKAVGSMLLSANGNAFSSGVHAFAKGGILGPMGGILTQPTIFPMANGGLGLGGEAGDEAVMPIKRLANGKLGVHAEGSTAAGGSGSVAITLTFNDNRTQGSATSKSGGDIPENMPKLAELIKGVVITTITKEMRPGGLLA